MLPHLRDTLSVRSLRARDGVAAGRSSAGGVADTGDRRHGGAVSVSELVGSLPADTRVVALAPAALQALARLAATLPADPRARECARRLAEALGRAGDAPSSLGAGGATIPAAVLEHLMRLRVLGPHMRASPRWAALMRHIDAALQSPVPVG